MGSLQSPSQSRGFVIFFFNIPVGTDFHDKFTCIFLTFLLMGTREKSIVVQSVMGKNGER